MLLGLLTVALGCSEPSSGTVKYSPADDSLRRCSLPPRQLERFVLVGSRILARTLSP